MNRDRNKIWTTFSLVFVLALFCLLIVLPHAPNWVPGSTWFSKQSFHLGLDLKGGTELIYEADTSNIPGKDVEYAVSGARDVIERRVNVFGVAEPLIQTAKSDNGYRLIVDLPGIKNPDQAIKMIGETPTLEFRSLAAGDSSSTPNWEYTGLTGKYLQSAIVNFDSQTVEPEVAIEFNAEGAKIFGDLTTQNVGKPIAIFLDNQLISAPTVNMAITSGKAVISGRFTLVEAKELASRLSAGALPLPIKLISQQNIGPSLGRESMEASLVAGLLGIISIVLIMVLSYGWLGVTASFALLIYTIINLALYKLIPVTLTLPGIAGFILSLGMAVDANILIFERMMEEKKLGKSASQVLVDGFRRAWPAIRDGNYTTLIVCFILFELATGMVKGFAVTLFLGVLLSMFSALTITKNLLQIFQKDQK